MQIASVKKYTNQMGATERVKEYLDLKNITKYKFCQKTGFSNKFLDNSSNMGTNKAEIILHHYPDINPSWLLTGNGEMLINDKKTGSELTPFISTEQKLGVPYYDVDFSGGFISILNNQTITPDYNIVFEPFKDAQLWCNVTGNSMAEKINHGDIIALKELKNWDGNILFGEIYAVVTDQLRTIKVIRKSDDKDNYKLVPINTIDFDETEVKKTSIERVFMVLGAIKKFF